MTKLIYNLPVYVGWLLGKIFMFPIIFAIGLIIGIMRGAEGDTLQELNDDLK